MAKNKKMDKVRMKLSEEGIDWLKSNKRICTQIAAMVEKDADTVKRWVRTNHVRLVGADVVESVKRITGQDMSKFIVKG